MQVARRGSVLIVAAGHKNGVTRTVLALATTVSLALAVRVFVVEAFHIPSPAMSPTLLVGDRLFVLKSAYRSAAPARGDVVVFRYPRDESKDFIMRVIGVGGDTVHVSGRIITLNGGPLSRCELGPLAWQDGSGIWALERNGTHRYLTVVAIDGHTRPEDDEHAAYCVDRPCLVPAGQLFVMGDNRDNSYDSRYWGFVPVASVRGRASRIYSSRGDHRWRSNANGEPVIPPGLGAAARECDR